MEGRVYHAGAAIALAIARTVGGAAAIATFEEWLDPKGNDSGAGDPAAAGGQA